MLYCVNFPGGKMVAILKADFMHNQNKRGIPPEERYPGLPPSELKPLSYDEARIARCLKEFREDPSGCLRDLLEILHDLNANPEQLARCYDLITITRGREPIP